MKLLAFSDLHASKPRADQIVAASAQADLVLGAGDFCNMRQGLDAAMDLLAGLRAPMLAIPGNAESPDELSAALQDGTTMLHATGCQIDGLTFFGLGCAVPPTPFGPWSVDLNEDEAETLLAACDHADVLLLHSPPKGVADRTSSGHSVGSVAIRDAIERIQPRLAVCGHIHDCWGATGQIGTTRVVNLGPTPNWFDL